MEIIFRQNELAFVFDKNTKVKRIIPHGEREFAVFFEEFNENNESSEHVTSPETQAIDQVQIPIKEDHNFEFEQVCGVNFPTLEDIIEYIKLKENYTYDNFQIQEHFFGRILSSREENGLHRKLIDLINRAKYNIGEEEKGRWKDDGFRKISNTQRTKVHTFVKQKSHINENKVMANNDEAVKIEN